MENENSENINTLQTQLEEAKTSLKSVDENIKKLIGRNPSESHQRRFRRSFENNEPLAKKRFVDSSVLKNQIISKVIAKDAPTREEVLEAQKSDEKSRARHRRMFGALIGTLQKFQQEESKMKLNEEKRAQVEKKLEEQQIKEREELKKERQDLFINRKRKQSEIRLIETKMNRMKDQQEWEQKQKPLYNFIKTKTKPNIFYRPKYFNENNKKLLEVCKQNIEEDINKKRQNMYKELDQLEQRMKHYLNKYNEFDDVPKDQEQQQQQVQENDREDSNSEKREPAECDSTN